MKSLTIRSIFFTLVFLLIVIPAVDGNVYNYFKALDNSTFNSHVKSYVKNYIHINTRNLYNIKRRSNPTFSIIDSVLMVHQLPTQLRYLAVVESELKNKAVSRVGAVGLWQLMPETGRILGLKITARYDERKNDYKSSKAAAMHLRDLHKQFDDWLLAIAAYNCGEVPVNAAIRQSGSKDFWKLQSFLPRETRDYVNKFIASCYYFEGIENLMPMVS